MTEPSGGTAAGGGRREPPVFEDRSTRKRRAVVEAATDLFLQHGYAGTSMDQIAAAAAVSKPTVYKFFADKEQLLAAIVLGTLDRAGAPFLAALTRLAQTSRLERDLPELGRHYLRTVMQPRVLQLRRLVIGASHDLPDVARAYYERAPEQTLRALAGCFGELAARGLLRIESPDTAAAHFAFLVLGRALDKSLFCGDHPFPAADLTAQANAGVSTFLAAYGRGSG
jgi:TetR/AcrR family transcriptional repressor of mexJK operon